MNKSHLNMKLITSFVLHNLKAAYILMLKLGPYILSRKIILKCCVVNIL